jgi:hypothetical protein
MNSSEKLLTEIDYEALKGQKKLLMDVMVLTGKSIGTTELDGLIHLIDAIQDYAIDVLGMDEDKICYLRDN